MSKKELSRSQQIELALDKKSEAIAYLAKIEALESAGMADIVANLISDKGNFNTKDKAQGFVNIVRELENDESEEAQAKLAALYSNRHNSGRPALSEEEKAKRQKERELDKLESNLRIAAADFYSRYDTDANSIWQERTVNSGKGKTKLIGGPRKDEQDAILEIEAREFADYLREIANRMIG